MNQRNTITTKKKKQFIAISECDITPDDEIRYQYVDLYGGITLVLALNVDSPERAAKLWKNRAFLVSAARETDLSRYILINLLNSPYGFAMLGHEDLHPEPATRFHVPKVPKFCQSKKL
jgi:hypothetical protein